MGTNKPLCLYGQSLPTCSFPLLLSHPPIRSTLNFMLHLHVPKTCGLALHLCTLVQDLDAPATLQDRQPKVATATSTIPPPTQRPSASGVSLTQPKPKCMGIFLGGAKQPRGRNGSVIGQPLCCDALR